MVKADGGGGAQAYKGSARAYEAATASRRFWQFAVLILLAIMWTKYGAALAALAAQQVFAAPAITRRADAPTASTKNGTYVGVHSAEYNQDFFLGVPFAQPPVGDLRFRIAQSLNSSWTGTHEATSYSDECVGYGVSRCKTQCQLSL